MKKLNDFIVIPLILIFYLGLVSPSEVQSEQGDCESNSNGPCKGPIENNRYIFYDINYSEGFNLRRDVYMRMVIFIHNIITINKYKDFKLVLPPWNYLYHWHSRDIGSQGQIPWGLFFDIISLKRFAPVVETYELLTKEKSLTIDRLYMLNHFPNAFEDGNFNDKVEIPSSCPSYDMFWGYKNITCRNQECVYFQGSVSLLKNLIDLHPEDKYVMFSNAEVSLHEDYGSKTYWDARKSMRFNMDLVDIAEDFIEKELKCFKPKCDNYISVHWRRGDFAKSRYKEVPSVNSTADQIYNTVEKYYKSLIKHVFIATDSQSDELENLVNRLETHGFIVKWFSPSYDVRARYKDGGVAIIDQIICSHAVYFIGTHESTFTFRIQEEREILGFESDTTFNRLCPDVGACERMSRWSIVN